MSYSNDGQLSRIWQPVISSLTVPVYYEDTDFSGYLFHPNYLKYCDRAREELIGLTVLRTLWEEGRHFVVKSAWQDFTTPARHGDTLEINTWIRFSRSPLMSFRHMISKKGSPAPEKPVVTALVELVSVNKKGYPVRLPELLFNLLQGKLSAANST